MARGSKGPKDSAVSEESSAAETKQSDDNSSPQFQAGAGEDGILQRIINALYNVSSNAGTHPRWDERAMDELLKHGAFQHLYDELLRRFEVDRCTQAATWCATRGLETGHVALVYLNVRNGSRHASGSVPTAAQVTKTLVNFVYLVLRVVQDTVAFQRIQGKRNADHVYSLLVHRKIITWLQNLKPIEAWPALSDIVKMVRKLRGVSEPDSLPDHSWITSVQHSGLTTVRFGTPDRDLRQACARSSDAKRHRIAVCDHFFAVVEPMTWRNFLSAPLELFIPDHDMT